MNNRIVLAEDDEYISRILLVFLKNNGFETKHFTNGGDVYDYVTQNPNQVDLLLTDLLMPGMGGFELLGKLKEAGALPPTVILSGQKREEEILQGLQYGVLDYILKPVSPKVIVAKIKNLLERPAA